MRTLYHYWLIPTCRKVRILLKEKKLDFQLEVKETWKPKENLSKLNPSEQVPVLIDLNSTVICEDNAICEYIEEAYPEQTFLGDDIYQRAETRRLISWFDHKFQQDITQKIIFEKIHKRHISQGEPESQTIRLGLKNLHQHMDYLTYLIERRNWLAGDRYSLADITAAAHLSTLDFLGDINWDRWDAVKEWYMRIKSRPAFRPLLSDQVSGINPPEHYTNLDF